MALHPGDQEAINQAREAIRARGYPPLTDRQRMIIKAAFKDQPVQQGQTRSP